MKRKFRHGDFLETERQTRVKLHKSGKHWVSTCLSKFGLLRFFGSQEVVEDVQISEDVDLGSQGHLFKGLTTLGALVGGAGLTSAQVSADELPTEKAYEKETLAEAETAELSAASETPSQDVASETVSVQTQEQEDEASVEASISASISESTSISESLSISASESASISASESESASVSGSSSEAASLSESAETSTSEGDKASESAAEASSETESSDQAAEDSRSADEASREPVLEDQSAADQAPQAQAQTRPEAGTSSQVFNVDQARFDLDTAVDPVIAQNGAEVTALAGAASVQTNGKTPNEAAREDENLQAGLERSTAQEDDRSQAGYYAAVSNLAGNKAQVKEDLEKALAHNDGAASDLASYKSRIDAANTIEEIGSVVKEAQTKYPAANVAPQEETPEEKAQKEAQLNSAKASAKTSAQAILDARAQANNSQATGADPAHVAAVQAKIDAAQSTAEVDKIISDLNDSASADTILVPKTDQDGRRYFEDVDTGKKYYLEPNWNEDSIKGQNSMRWELEPGQELRVINNPSEPLSVQQLKYKGFHETADGDQVIDMMYTHTPRSAYVWTRLNLRISDDLQKRIDWTKSYYEDRNGNVYRFINGSQANDKLLVLSNIETGTETKRSPIRLYLRDNVTRAELDTIDTTIQARLLDANGNVYTKYMGGTNDSNMSLTGYGSYTQSVTIPKTTSTNLKSGLNPYLQVISSVDQAPDFVSSQNTVSYNPSENKLYVASQFHKKDTDNRNEKLNGQSIAYRLAFDKELLDVLKEDDYGYIGYVEPSITSGMKGAVNPNNVRTGFTRNQVNVVGDMAYVIYAPNEFDYNDETGQIIYANKGTQGFIDNISTELSGQQFTLTTLNVDSDNLKKLYPTINDQQPEMTAISVHSAMIIENDHGIDRVKMTTDQEAVARQGDKIEIRFAKPTNHGVKRSDLIDGEILYWNESAAKLAMKAGEAPIIGHLGVYPASRGARGSDARYDFAVNANNTVYTYTLPHDFKLAAGSEISLYTGANGKLVDNSGEVYINGVKVAEFGPGQAETSYAPRLIIGTEVNSSALLDRTQYMPVVEDMYDFDKVITGYTYVPNQLVEISYIDANSGQTRYVRTMSGNAAELGASYTVEGDKTYPEPGKGLYKFEYAIPDTDRVVKDSPIVARSFNYQVGTEERALADNEEAIQTSVGSDAVIARVLIQVTYDLNQPNGTSTRRVMTYAAPVETTDAAGNTTAIDNSDVPRNEDFSNEVGYTNNGLEGNMANDPTLEGYRFLGWNTAQDGSGEFVTPETAFQNSTTVYAQWEKVSMAEEFEPGYDNISLEEGQAGTVNAPSFVKNGQAANPEVLQYTTSASGVTVNNDGSITVPASLTEGQAGQTIQIPVTITYGDNSTDTVDVYVDVTRKPENELYEPSVTPVEKDYGQAPTQDEIKNAVTVLGYEENPAYPGQTPTVTIDDPNALPDGKTPGVHEVPVTVEYLDGTKDPVTVKVIVNKSNEDTYQPSYPQPTVTAGETSPTELTPSFTANVPNDPNDPIGPSHEEQGVTPPAGTKFSINVGTGGTGFATADGDQATIDPNTGVISFTPGSNHATETQVNIPVKVTYPDETSDEVTATVTVKPQPENDKYEPSVAPVEKDYGEPATENDVTTAVTIPGYEENPAYPDQRPTVTVDDPSTLPDGNTPGNYTVPVTVTYPDGTKDQADVTVTVKMKDKAVYDTSYPAVNHAESGQGSITISPTIFTEAEIQDPAYPNDPLKTVTTKKAMSDVPTGTTFAFQDPNAAGVTTTEVTLNNGDTASINPITGEITYTPAAGHKEDSVQTLPTIVTSYPTGQVDHDNVTVKVEKDNDSLSESASNAESESTHSLSEAMSQAASASAYSTSVAASESAHSTSVAASNSAHSLSEAMSQAASASAYSTSVAASQSAHSASVATSEAVSQVASTSVATSQAASELAHSASQVASQSAHSLSEVMSQAASASAYSTSVAASESAHSASVAMSQVASASAYSTSVAASQSAHSASVATSEAVSQVASTSVAASESAHSLSEAMSQAASASAYSTSVANSESTHSASVAASQSAHSASVATSEAVSQVASTAVAASESAHSLSEAMSQAASASAYSTSVVASQSAHSASVATSEAVSQVASTSVATSQAASELAHSASQVASQSAHSLSEVMSQAASASAYSTSVAASESAHSASVAASNSANSLSEAMSQVASASAYSTSVAASQSAHSASVATSEAVSQVASTSEAASESAHSTSVAASESAHSTSVAASNSAHSLSEAMSQAASASAYSTSVAASQSAHSASVATSEAVSQVASTSVAASESANSLSEAMSQVASASAYSTSVANSQSAHSASVAASESAHSLSEAMSQAASASAYSTSVAASESAHSASIATSEAVSQVASTSEAASESAHSASVAASNSAHSLSEVMSQAASASAYSTSVAASESAHSASVAASESTHSASVAASNSANSLSVAMSQAASASAYSTSVAASESAHSASVATSEAVSQVASTSVAASESAHSLSEAMSQAASASAYSTSVANSQSAHSASIATSEAVSQVASTSVATSQAASELAHSASQVASQSAHSASVATSEAVSQVASTSVVASESAHSLSEAMSQAASASAYSTSVANSESTHSASVAASQSAHSASVATSEAVSQVASTSVAASESAHSLSEAMSQVASASAYSTSVANSQSAHSASVAASESAHSLSEAMSQAASASAHSTSVAASNSANSLSVAMSQVASASAYSTSVAASESAHSLSEAMSQVASASAYSTSVAASESAHSASVAASNSANSLSVAMSQAASASAYSTSVAASNSAHSLSEAMSQAASASAYSTSVAASQSAHSASIATSEAVSQATSTSEAAHSASQAASQSANSASVVISELMSQLASASTAASESAYSASVATSEAVSQVASTSVAASESAHSASVATSEAVSQVASTSLAASESAHSASVAASALAHSLSEAMSETISEHVSLSELDSRSDSLLESQQTSTSLEQSATISEQGSVIASLLSEAQSQAPNSESNMVSEVHSHGPGWIESELPEFDIESFSTSLSASASASLETSISASQSESVAVSLSQAASASESISLSESASISASQSSSDQAVAPGSTSDSLTESTATSTSEGQVVAPSSMSDSLTESTSTSVSVDQAAAPSSTSDSAATSTNANNSAAQHASDSALSSASQSAQTSSTSQGQAATAKQMTGAQTMAHRRQPRTNQVLPKTGGTSSLLAPGLLFALAGLGMVSSKRKKK